MKKALLVIDVQKGFDEPVWGKRNNPGTEENIAALISAWRGKELPVIHVQHCSVEPDSPLRPELAGNDFKEEAKPLESEKCFQKSVNSAFIGTGLEQYLRERDLTSLVVVGMTTDHCVSTSVRMAANLGFEVTLISDATATFERKGENGVLYSAQEIHEISLVSLNGEFCRLRTTNEMLQD